MALNGELEPRFAPFMRSDRYGLLGKAEQSTFERVRLLIFLVFVFPFKLTCAVMCVIGCHLTCRLASWLPVNQCADLCAWTGKVWCRMALFFLGFNVRWVKAPGAEYSKAKPVGIISNHSRYAFWTLNVCMEAKQGGLKMDMQAICIETLHATLNCPYNWVNIESSFISYSWVDILIHLSRSFPSFAAREGTQNLLLVGYIR